MSNFLKTLASDLLTLEVNTIIKSNTSCSKMPACRRIALLEIADTYRGYLVNFGLFAYADESGAKPAEGVHLIRWWYGGEFSFIEINVAANEGANILRSRIEKSKNQKEIDLLEDELKMLDRIVAQTSNIIGMFKIRRRMYNVSSENTQDGYFHDKEGAGVSEYAPFPSQLKSRVWNNDLSLDDINKNDDIDLAPDQVTLIRKVWEIGTERVLLQTVIQIDGDVTSYITTDFMELQETAKQMTLNMHNQSIQTSTNFWSVLFNTVANIAGKGFSQIFGSK